MASSLPEYKRKTLEKRKAQLIEEYEAVNGQLGRVLDEAARVRLQRQAEALEEEIDNLQAQLGAPSSAAAAWESVAGKAAVQEPMAKAAPPTIHIDADNPPYAALRALLAAAFSPKELYRFCQERAKFRQVVGRFGPSHGLDDMIDELLDYCRTRLLWDDLVWEVNKLYPEQVTRFAADLAG